MTRFVHIISKWSTDWEKRDSLQADRLFQFRIRPSNSKVRAAVTINRGKLTASVFFAPVPSKIGTRFDVEGKDEEDEVGRG